jgi:hypothetical protein
MFDVWGAGYRKDGSINLRGLIQDEIRWFGYTNIGRV